jgi:hypothetical protein
MSLSSPHSTLSFEGQDSEIITNLFYPKETLSLFVE